jgi:hypothetical protein
MRRILNSTSAVVTVVTLGGAFLVSDSFAAPKKQPPGPVEQKKLEVKTGKPFEKKAAKVRTLPVQAGGVFVSSVPIVAEAAIVGTAPAHWGLPASWGLIDLKTGAKRAAFKTVGEGSAATKTAVVAFGDTEADRPALLSLTDGKLTEPQVTVPGGGKVSGLRIVVDQHKPVTWVMARRASDGRPYQAQWKPPYDPKIELVDDMPFWPTQVSGRNGIQAWTDAPKAAARDCDRVVFDALDPWRCRPLPSSQAAPMDLLEDCARNDGEAWLVDDCGGTPPLSCGKARALLMSPTPSRALAVCTDDPAHPKLVLWSPKKTWLWDDDSGVNWKSVIPERAPHSLAGIELFSRADAAVKHWLDATNGIVWNGPPMQVLQLSEHRDDRHRLLQPPGKPKELWLLDIDGGTLEKIADDIDCDTTLYTYAQSGERATIECMPKAAASNIYKDTARLNSWKWMEVIDFKARKRWRTTEVFESRIGTDGTVVGTKRGKPSHLAVVETP